MIKSMYSGVAGLRAHQSKMDVIGNNIANVNTYGYKAGRATFKESIYQTISASSNGSNTYGGKNASQVGYGSQIGTIDLMFSSGSYAPTDSPTDCMIDGNGFFLVGKKTDAGADDASGVPAGSVEGLTLTRVGDFRFDGDGYLVDSNGYVVYGVVNTDVLNTDGTFDPDFTDGTVLLQPIRIQASDGTYDGVTGGAEDSERLNVNSIRIDDKGNVLGIVAGAVDEDGNETSKPVVLAKLAIANVPNPNGLEKNNGPYYKAVSNTGKVAAFGAGDGGTGLVISNGLEMANVDLAKEFSEMITTQRGFQANTRIITVSDEMLQEIMAIKR